MRQLAVLLVLAPLAVLGTLSGPAPSAAAEPLPAARRRLPPARMIPAAPPPFARPAPAPLPAPVPGQRLRLTVVGASLMRTTGDRRPWDDDGGRADVLNRHRSGPPMAPYAPGRTLPFAPDPFIFLHASGAGGGVLSPTELDTFDPTWHTAVTFLYSPGTEVTVEVADHDADPATGRTIRQDVGTLVLSGPEQLALGRHVHPWFDRVNALTYVVEDVDAGPGAVRAEAERFAQARAECAEICRSLGIALRIHRAKTGQTPTTLDEPLLADLAARKLIRQFPHDPGEGSSGARNYILVGGDDPYAVECRVHRPRLDEQPAAPTLAPTAATAAPLPAAPAPPPAAAAPEPAAPTLTVTVIGAVIAPTRPSGQPWDRGGTPFGAPDTRLVLSGGSRHTDFRHPPAFDTFEPFWNYSWPVGPAPGRPLTLTLTDAELRGDPDEPIATIVLDGADAFTPGRHTVGPVDGLVSLSYLVETKDDEHERWRRQRDACRATQEHLRQALIRRQAAGGGIPERLDAATLSALVADGYLHRVPVHDGLWPHPENAWTIGDFGDGTPSVHCHEH